jgi:glyoxylase-like metal-dependent hydrolase (beta-lactamase superfamily II)
MIGHTLPTIISMGRMPFMWINQPGKVSDHVTMVGSMAFPCYFIKGERTALVDGGITPLAPLIQQEFSSPERQPHYVLLTHSHFDHVGCLGLIRKLSPRVIVVGSLEAANILAKPKVHEFVLDMSREQEKSLGMEEVPLELEDLQVDMVLGEGETIDLGGVLTVEVILTPGHTRCSVSYLLKPDGVLFAGESLGTYISEEESGPEFTSDFAEYIDSLKKIQKIAPNALALPHQGVLTGPDALRHLENAIRDAESFHHDVLKMADAGRSQDEIVAEMFPRLRKGPAAMEPERSFRINLDAMVRVALKEREQS